MANNEAKVTVSAVDQTKATFEAIKKNFSSLGDQAGKISGLMGSVGVAIGAAFSAGSIMNLVEMLDSLDKMSEKTGIATESLSALRYAGEIADVSQEQLGTGLKKLAKYMADAAGGNDVAAGAFKSLGIEITNTDGSLRKTDQVLIDIAQRFQGWEDGPGKAAIAMRLFGKSGDDMIPMLNLGKVGLQSMASEAQALGAVYGGDVAKNAAEFNDNLKKIKLAAEGTAITLSGPLVRALGDASQAFIEAKKSGESYLGMLARLANKVPLKVDDVLSADATRAFPMLRMLQMLQGGGAALAAPKTSVDIQGYVNKLGISGGAGRGWVNPKVAAPVIGDTSGNKVKAPDHFADNFINQLITEYAGLSGTMSKTDEVTRKLDTATEKFTGTQRTTILTLAGQIDKQKAMTAAAEDMARVQGIVLDAQDKADAAHYASLGTLEKLANDQAFELTLLGKYPDAIERARFERDLSNQERAVEADLVNRGLQNGWDEIRMEEERAKTMSASKAARSAFNNIQVDKADQTYNPNRGMKDGIKQYMDEIAKSGDFMKNSVVNAFTSMEDALVNFVKTGKLDFSSLADSIISDMARMIVRKNITAPMAAWASNMFSFANGGIMSSAGALPLNSYAAGGVANSPQLALFGEGRINEAYVPLPDGKSIPVNLGRNSGSNVVVQVIESPGNGGQVSRKNEGGADIIQIMVERVKSAIAGDISRGSGSVPAAMASTYGLNRVAGSY